MKLNISIIIPTYNSNVLIKRTLESLASTTLPKSITEVIVIENGPKLNVESICQDLQKQLPLKYIYSEQDGLSNARNLGIKNSAADVMIFFDNDMEFSPNTLVEYEKTIQQYGVDFFYGGPVLADYEERPPEWLRQYLPWSAKEHSLGDKIKFIDKALFLGGNHAVPKKAFDTFEGYDDMCATGTTGMMGEERRLQMKLLNAGYKGIYIPGAVVYHWVPKERCSQEWTIQRNYRAGLTKSVPIKNALPQNSCLILDIPCYIIKDYFISLYNYIISILLLKSRDQVFLNKFKLSYVKGIIDGFNSFKQP